MWYVALPYGQHFFLILITQISWTSDQTSSDTFAGGVGGRVAVSAIHHLFKKTLFVHP